MADHTNRPVTETHFVVKCHTCGQAYLVERGVGQGGQTAFLAKGPRCINTSGNVETSGKGAYYGVVPQGQVCGALLGRGMFRGQGHRNATREDLLGWTVARKDQVFTKPPVVEVEKVVERVIDTEETAALRAEIARLKERYETPCPGLVHGHHFAANGGEVPDIRPCGGFLGHPGQCAEVW